MYGTLHASLQVLDLLREGFLSEEGERKAIDKLYNMIGGERDMISETMWEDS